MPRSRNIKYSFFQNEELDECEPRAQLLFIGLWTLADRDGVLEDRPKRIKASLFPFRDVDVDALLGQLEAHRFIIRYSFGGHKCIWVPKFGTHQKPHVDEKRSSLPRYDQHHASTTPAQGYIGAEHLPSTGYIGAEPEKGNGAPYGAPALIDDRGMLNEERGMRNVDGGTPEQAPDPPTKRFVKPTLAEVTAYCLERGKGINPEAWLAHYEANGWRVGKNPMKSWKHAVITWETSEWAPKPEVSRVPTQEDMVGWNPFGQPKE